MQNFIKTLVKVHNLLVKLLKKIKKFKTINI